MEYSLSYLNIKSLCKSYKKEKVLDNISLEMNEKSFSCILGPSGCGKSTLLKLIAGFETVDSGEIYLNNNDITFLSPSKRNIGIVFQNYALFPNLTAYKNISFALQNKKLDRNLKKEKINEILRKFHLEEHSQKYPYQLSGGQQQRVALARSLILSPKVLLLDEPLSALDAKVREHLRAELKEIHEQFNITVIMVTHDQDEALIMADKIFVMDKGEIIQSGSPSDIYEKPENLFVANFIGTMNQIKLDEGNIFIRPEHFKIVDEDQSYTIKSKIEGIDYRGSFYRLTLSHKNQNFYVDISSLDMEEKQLIIQNNIYLNLPEEYCLKLSS